MSDKTAATWHPYANREEALAATRPATVQPCAPDCELVAMLLREIARARGVTVDVIRVGHGLDPIPDKSGTLCALTQPHSPVRHEETTA